MERQRSLAFMLLIVLLTAHGVFAQEGVVPALEGQIAYIGIDYNLYTLNGQSGTPSVLTDDAGPDGDNLHLYQWPTWSTDGRLAYFQITVSRAGQVHSTEVFVSKDGLEPGQQVYSGSEEVF